MAGDLKEVARAHLADAGVKELPDDWDVVTLGDLFTEDRGIAVGVMYPGDHDPDGVPLIKAGDLNESIINPQPDFRISKDKHHEYRRTALEGGELLMTLVGNVGQCAVVPPRMAGWNTARAVAVMRLADPSETHFVQQCLLSRPLQHLMDVWCNTTVQATLNLKEIRQLPIPWPSKKSRDAIAAFGKALDDKIELNSRMNATLETMARALFQSWFVDFDPVRAKLDGRPAAALDPATAALFPPTFDETELGHIPHGWQVKTIDELAERVAMGPFGSDIKVSTFVPEGIPVVSGQHLRGTLLDDSEFNFVSIEHANRLKRSNVQRGDVIFTHAGSIGQVAYIPEASRYERYIVSQRQFYMRCNRALVSPFYITSYFKTPEGQHRLLANTSSTGVPSISQPVTYLRQLKMVVPPSALLKVFDTTVGQIHLKMADNDHQSRTLATLRDTLLPKLLSGELSLRPDHV
jgi:type I restriction enzyme, S subunit